MEDHRVEVLRLVYEYCWKKGKKLYDETYCDEENGNE